MRYFLLSLLFLTGCKIEIDDKVPVSVNVVCYDKNNEVTVMIRDFKGSVQIVDDPDKSYKSEKCIIERSYEQKQKGQ